MTAHRRCRECGEHFQYAEDYRRHLQREHGININILERWKSRND